MNYHRPQYRNENYNHQRNPTLDNAIKKLHKSLKNITPTTFNEYHDKILSIAQQILEYSISRNTSGEGNSDSRTSTLNVPTNAIRKYHTTLVKLANPSSATNISAAKVGLYMAYARAIYDYKRVNPKKEKDKRDFIKLYIYIFKKLLEVSDEGDVVKEFLKLFKTLSEIIIAATKDSN